MNFPKGAETWGDVVDRCAEKERRDRPVARLADLLAVPSPAELRGAGCHPASVPLVGAMLAGMAEQTSGAFLSMSGDRLDAAAHHVRMVLGAPTLADVVRAALAAALFGWLP